MFRFCLLELWKEIHGSQSVPNHSLVFGFNENDDVLKSRFYANYLNNVAGLFPDLKPKI